MELPTANLTQEPGTITPVEIPVAAPAQAAERKPKTEAQQAANQPPRRQRPPAQAPAPPPPAPSFFSPFSFFGR
jgi:hypothetical protein